MPRTNFYAHKLNNHFGEGDTEIFCADSRILLLIWKRVAPLLTCSLSVAVCLMTIIFESTARAQIETDPGGVQPEPFTIADGNSFTSVTVRGTSSLDVTGGEVTRTINAFDQSVVTISGGMHGGASAGNSGMITVTGGTLGGVGGEDTSTVTIAGGSTGSIGASDASTLHFSGGTAETASVSGGTLNLSGGTVTLAAFASDGGTLNMSDGVVELIFDVLNASNTYNISGGVIPETLGSDDSQLDITGGTIGTLKVEDDSSFDLSGGQVDEIVIETASEVFIFGFDLQLVDNGTDRLLTGTLFDGTSINAMVTGSTERLTFVPEPTTAVLLLLGSFCLRIRSSSRRYTSS